MFFFLIGSIVGSFLNVIIIRTPNRESIVFPRSHCRLCKNKIPFYQNIPILSYLLLKGRCYKCKEKISYQYILIEMITGILFFVSFNFFEFYEGILLAAVFSCLITLSAIDFLYLLIPLKSILILYFLVILKYYLLNLDNILDLFLGATITTLYLGLPALFISYIKHNKSVLGLGDILLTIFVGSWLGFFNGIVCLFIASMFGIIFTIYMQKTKSRVNNKKIPFGSCISIAFALIVIFEEYININLFI